MPIQKVPPFLFFEIFFNLKKLFVDVQFVYSVVLCSSGENYSKRSGGFLGRFTVCTMSKVRFVNTPLPSPPPPLKS